MKYPSLFKKVGYSVLNFYSQVFFPFECLKQFSCQTLTFVIYRIKLEVKEDTLEDISIRVISALMIEAHQDFSKYWASHFSRFLPRVIRHRSNNGRGGPVRGLSGVFC